jgi:hypothetical protein
VTFSIFSLCQRLCQLQTQIGILKKRRESIILTERHLSQTDPTRIDILYLRPTLVNIAGEINEITEEVHSIIIKVNVFPWQVDKRALRQVLTPLLNHDELLALCEVNSFLNHVAKYNEGTSECDGSDIFRRIRQARGKLIEERLLRECSNRGDLRAKEILRRLQTAINESAVPVELVLKDVERWEFLNSLDKEEDYRPLSYRHPHSFFNACNTSAFMNHL